MKAVFWYGVLMVGCLFSCGQRGGDGSVHDTDTASAAEMVLQDDRITLPTEMPRNVEEIQQTYRNTTMWVDQHKLDTLSFAYNCQEEKRGKVTYYTKDDKLLLIEHQYSEYDHYEAIDRYYIQNDSIYFVFLKGTAWSFESGEGDTKDDITEKRVYLVQGDPIRCLEKKYSIHSKSPEETDVESIANIEVDCPSATSVMAPYEVLKRHYKQPTSGCLE